MSALLVTVCVPVPLFAQYDYLVPENLAPTLRRGCRVRVPFGRRELVGVVVRAPHESAAEAGKFRPVSAVLDDNPLLPTELLALCEWAASYYHHPLGEVLVAALPGRLRHGEPAGLIEPLAYGLTAAGRTALAELPERHRAQRALLQALTDGPRLRTSLDTSAAAIKHAVEAGWLLTQTLDKAPLVIGPTPAPTPEQAAAQAELEQAHGFDASLIEGVTGSGKTELYLRRIEVLTENGGQALVLAPEISLTPQLEARFRDRLGDSVVSFHSGMTDRAREQAWLRARSGSARVIVGTRSAIWLPFAQLKLIVVDEEHDTSYKQQDGLRYSARDVAILRAQKLGIPVLLGSATPSLETLHNAGQKRYRHLRLQQRVRGSAPPKVRVLDVRALPLDHGLSQPLLKAIEKHLDAKGQVLLFINRRGYAPVLLCHACGWSAPCTQCDAHMTLHRGRNLLICHHCSAQQPVPRSCPSCSASPLMAVGAGTERIEQALANRFPQYRVARFDSDRVTSPSALAQQLEDIREGRVQILVGTQILAKGHDFPNLSLVGIVSADQALYGTDFRAVERMGQLVTQVAGRAGRGEVAGEVWLQTHEPDHPLLRTLAEHGYRALSEALLKEREQTGLPPYSHLALIRAESQDAGAALRFLSDAQPLFSTRRSVLAMEPMASGMERRAGFVRAQMLLQSGSRSALHAVLGAAVPQLAGVSGARNVRWSVDVDPYDLM